MFDLSVILPNYNHSLYLPECLHAIFSQSSPPREVIVIDDGSTDHSLDVLRGLKDRFPTLRVLENPKNLGIHESVNRGIREAKGKYLAFCAADDFVFRDFFARCEEAFSSYPDAGLCCGDFATFQEGKNHVVSRLLQIQESKKISPDELLILMKKHQFAIASYVAVCRKDLVEKWGGYKLQLSCIADVYLCYQIAFQHPIVYVPEVFASQRIVPQSYGQKIRKNFGARMQLWQSFLTEMIKEDPLTQRKIIESRLLGIGGYFVLVFLLLNPRYWPLFPSTTINVLGRKWKAMFQTH